ncbi:hypothetical protein [Sphingobium nicotianae]|uniref:Cupin domain-containing protein n=1 Tax=Sphingobium nicotianae TaxID=2782607 RepID=A0A9X1AJ62_9SPHN|nr:hypothetical protein [Sphingobium nicotianae]MBT2185804.1 hypothetical protein [Sphingobium nicotianae]
MDSSRRNLLAALPFALLAGSGRAAPEGRSFQPSTGTCAPGTMEVIHVYADARGVTHHDRVRVYGTMKQLPVKAVLAACIAPGVEDWHTAPGKTFTINTVGDIVGEFGDGSSTKIGKGDLVYLEDTSGKGHVTRLMSQVANLFIQVEDDFDFLAWAGKPPAA